MATPRTNGREITRTIILALADAGGGIVESFLEPYGRLRVSNMFVENGKIQRSIMRKKLLALQKQGYITVKEKKGEIALTLQSSGQEKALEYKIRDLLLVKPEWWDRKWRMVLFDVPESQRVTRSKFKKTLDVLGFVQLQHSVYVHPYACHNEIEYIRTTLGIKDFVKMVIVDKIEGESVLRKHFDI
jgi:DNA-binding transcriptional regulator PaaX